MKEDKLAIKKAHNLYRAREIAKEMGIEKLRLTEKDMELLYELGEYGIMYSEDANSILSESHLTGLKRKSKLRIAKLISGKNGINFLGHRGRKILTDLGYNSREIQTKDKEPSKANNTKADYYKIMKVIKSGTIIKPRYIIHEEVDRGLNPEEKEHHLWRHEINPRPLRNWILYYAHFPKLDEIDKSSFEYFGGMKTRTQYKEILMRDIDESLEKFSRVMGAIVIVKGKAFLEELIESLYINNFRNPVLVLEETEENLKYLSRAMEGFLKLPMKPMDYDYMADPGDQRRLIYGIGDICYCDNTLTDIRDARRVELVVEEMKQAYPKAKEYIYYTSSEHLQKTLRNEFGITLKKDVKIVYVAPEEVKARQRERLDNRESDDWQG